MYVKLNMFRATHRPSSRAHNCTGNLWFIIRGRLLDVVRHILCPATSTSYSYNNLPRIKKPEAASEVMGS